MANMVLNTTTTKKISNLSQRSPEEIKASIDRANAARKDRQTTRKLSTLRHDFLDADLWLQLASQRGLRLPPWGKPATVSNMRTWLHKVGWSQQQFEEWSGCSLRHFIALNSEWPLRAFAGVVLEVQSEHLDTPPSL